MSINWDKYTIGKDLRLCFEGDQDNRHRGIAQEHHIKQAMGLPKKLPVTAVPKKLLGDTWVYVISREEAKSTGRFHRTYAICNHCGGHIPVGRFGQHLGLYPLYWENLDGTRKRDYSNPQKRRPRYAKPCTETKRVTPNTLKGEQQ